MRPTSMVSVGLSRSTPWRAQASSFQVAGGIHPGLSAARTWAIRRSDAGLPCPAENARPSACPGLGYGSWPNTTTLISWGAPKRSALKGSTGAIGRSADTPRTRWTTSARRSAVQPGSVAVGQAATPETVKKLLGMGCEVAVEAGAGLASGFPDAAYREAGADLLTVHPESGPHVHRTLGRIRQLGAKAGLVFNPGTPLSILEEVVDLVDLVLIMSVNPGFGGQKFIDGSLRKIERARAILDRAGSPAHLQVDGGVTSANAGACVGAGADALVAGSFVFKGDYAANIAALKSAPNASTAG